MCVVSVRTWAGHLGRAAIAAIETRSSATADGPRDVLCQSKSLLLLHNSVGTICTTSREIEVMESEGYSRLLQART